MDKAEGAFLTIGELAGELGVPQHILRYWETRFPQLRPMQRSGNRRYYRTGDAALARRIHYLLTVEGFTVKGAQKALAVKEEAAEAAHAVPVTGDTASADLIARLEDIRGKLAAALA